MISKVDEFSVKKPPSKRADLGFRTESILLERISELARLIEDSQREAREFQHKNVLFLAEGGFCTAFHVFNLRKRAWVLKVPSKKQIGDKREKIFSAIEHGHKILRSFHVHERVEGACFHTGIEGVCPTPRLIYQKSCLVGSLTSYFNCGDLTKARDRLSLRQRLIGARQLFQAAKHLEKAGIVHGDIKPGNILVRILKSGKLEFRLSDFDGAMQINLHDFDKSLRLKRTFYTADYSTKEEMELISNLYKAVQEADSSEKRERCTIRYWQAQHLRDIYALGLTLEWLFTGVELGTQTRQFLKALYLTDIKERLPGKVLLSGFDRALVEDYRGLAKRVISYSSRVETGALEDLRLLHATKK